MRQLFLFLVLGGCLFACNDNKPEQDATIAPPERKIPDSSNKTSTTSNNNMPQQMPANSTTGMPQTPTITPQTITPQITTAGNTAAGMNPAHGKPGHKCEVAVGAPLNSAPARTATAPTITQPTIINQKPTIQTSTPSPKTVTAKGMNPPHGEPGHRCDISVGAPLNSAPAKPAAAPGAANITPMPAPSQNNAIVPALQNTSISTAPKTATAFTGKINPAHGQPGHDCKVAVGQPLP